MIYPSFLKQGQAIGVTAPSAGVGRSLDDYEASIAVLQAEGYAIRETASVRVNALRAADAPTRARELEQCFADPENAMVMCAAGGDFLNEILPEVSWKKLAAHPKWCMGASDPTGILYPLTVSYDIATLYGMNAGSFDVGTDFAFVRSCLDLLRGRKIVQHSSDWCNPRPGWEQDHLELDTPTRWESNVPHLRVSGRAVGGCVDVLKDLIGTPYDRTARFVRKYAEDGFIWFLDDFSMSAENLYRTLCQMRSAGWMAHVRAVVLGRVLFESSDTGMTYAEALQRALPGVPVIWNADIGHTSPAMTLMLGSVAHLNYRDGKAGLRFTLD